MDGPADNSTISLETLARGKWLLTAVKEPWRVRCIRLLPFGKLNQPHGCLMVFHKETTGLRGAMINWRNGEEMPLARVSLEGSLLEFQMEPGKPIFRSELANLLEGQFYSPSGEAVGPKLKMIKYVGPHPH